MLENYEPNSDVNLEREFPTHFDLLIYSTISACCDWAGTPAHLATIKDLAERDKEDYPEYWAAKTLGQIVRKIILSSKQTDRQCIYYLTMVVRLMNELDKSNHEYYSKVIINALLKLYDHYQPDQVIVNKLIDYYQEVDHVLRDRSSTFATILKQTRLDKVSS